MSVQHWRYAQYALGDGCVLGVLFKESSIEHQSEDNPLASSAWKTELAVFVGEKFERNVSLIRIHYREQHSKA